MSTRYAIILGCPRSGTTYLSRLFNTIPAFESLVGTLLPTAIPHVVNQPLEASVYNALAQGFERSLDAYLHSGRYHSKAAELQKWANAPTGLRGLWNVVAGPRPMPDVMVYKEPALGWAPRFVMDAFPDAPLIHIYRDGRDVANSLVRSYNVLTDDSLRTLKGSEVRIGRPYDPSGRDPRYVPWWVDDADADAFMRAAPYVRAAWMWATIVRRCHEAFAEAQAQNRNPVLQIRYEDLVTDPKTHGHRALEFLGGRPTRRFEAILDKTYTSSIGSYARRNPNEVAAAERVAEAELRRYGYTLTHTERLTLAG